MGNQNLAIYYVNGKKVYIYGCWDKETPNNDFDFYDIYLESECINEGNPFYDFPTWIEIKKYLEDNKLINN